MRPVRLRWRTFLFALVLAAPGCAWLFHKPRPDADLPASERPWRVRCNWIVASAEPATAPETGWLWAADTAGRRLVVTGTLEDGFLWADALRAASDHDDRDVVVIAASSRTVADACAGTVTRMRAREQAHVVTQAAAREGEDVEVSLVFPNEPAAPKPVSRLVVFGDSLSDPGNLKQRLMLFPAWPYWLGRFSNGPIWPEHFAKSTGVVVQNHSFGGAVSAPHDDVPSADVISAIQQGGQHFLTGSVQRYVTDYTERDLPAGVVVRPEQTVFVIWAGANDYISKEPFSGDIRTLLDTPRGRAGYEQVVAASTTSLVDLVRRLYAAGARNFVVVNLPDLGRTPAVLHNTSYRPDADVNEERRRIRLGRKLTQLTARHNAELRRRLTRAGREMNGETIVLVDTKEAVDRLLAGRSPDGSRRRFDYGLALGAHERTLRDGRAVLTVQDRCYTAGLLGTSDADAVCADEARALFWDSVHPTSYTHCWIAYFVARAMAQQGWLDRVPTPEEQRAYCRGAGAS